MNGPVDVPLLERLRSVPSFAFAAVVESDPLLGSRIIPYGRFCHEAADRINKLDTELSLARAQIQKDTARFEMMRAALISVPPSKIVAEDVAHVWIDRKAWADWMERRIAALAK